MVMVVGDCAAMGFATDRLSVRIRAELAQANEATEMDQDETAKGGAGWAVTAGIRAPLASAS